MSEQYNPDETDLRMTEFNLERPLVPFDDWTEHRKLERRSMVLGNILAGAIAVAVVAIIILVLTR